jgi:hypothetical protein
MLSDEGNSSSGESDTSDDGDECFHLVP